MKGFCCSCCTHSYLIAQQRARAFCLFHTSVQERIFDKLLIFQNCWVFMLNSADSPSNLAFWKELAAHLAHPAKPGITGPF